MWRPYRPPSGGRINKCKIQSIVIIVLIVVIWLMFGVILNLKRAYNLREYSIANDCTWIYRGTAYGDDRDYICK